MIRADGDALVMHVGERPYVVVGTGTLDLSSQILNLGAMTGMLQQLLPPAAQDSLEEFGAVEHRLPPHDHDAFTVVAARGGDDIWIEIRRRRKPVAALAAVPPESPVNADVPLALVDVHPTPDAVTETAAETPVETAVEMVAEAVVDELPEATIETPAVVTEVPDLAAEIAAMTDETPVLAVGDEPVQAIVDEPVLLIDEPVVIDEPVSIDEPVLIEEPPVVFVEAVAAANEASV